MAQIWWKHCLKKNVLGWQPITYEFDDAKKAPIFRNLPIRQWLFIDPTAESVDDAAYVIIDCVYDAEVAKGLWPDYADQIEQHKQMTGIAIIRPPQTPEMGGQYEDVQFQRPIVTLTIAFFRDQPCYMQPDEAVKAGHVVKGQVGTGNWKASPHPTIPGETNMQEQTRDQYTHPETGEEIIAPEHEDFQAHESNWPIKRCLRQTTAIATASVVLEDGECKYKDIPVAITVCIPVLNKPFGIGDPVRLMTMQDGRSSIMTSIKDHGEYYASPIAEIAKEAQKELPPDYQDGHLHPGMILWVPGDLLAKNPNGLSRFVNPPPMPAHLIEVDDRLKREINDSGGNLDVVQGKDKQALSGVAISLRQNAATTVLGFKSQSDEFSMQRLAELTHHSMHTRMTSADVYKIIQRYKPHVLDQIWAMDVETTISVRVSSGTGQKDEALRAEAKDEFKLGIISKQTTRELLKRDAAEEQSRIENEMMDEAKVH